MAEPYFETKLKTSIVKDNEQGPHIDRLYWDKKGFHAEYVYAIKVNRNQENGRISSRTGPSPDKSGILDFTGILGWLIAVKITFRCFYAKPSFSDFAVPYFLFFTAVVSGLVDAAL